VNNVNKRVTIILIGILLLTLFVPASVSANQAVTVTIDGQKLNFDVAPVIEKGRVLVPIRKIAEALDFRLDWSASAEVVHILKNNDLISLAIGGNVAFINDTPIELDVPPKIVNGRTLVPVRFVSETLNAQVHWLENTKTVVIKNKQLHYEQVLKYLEAGDLLNARKTAINSPVNNPFVYMDTSADATLGYTYYFPEGEATRFYIREGKRLTFVEPVNDVFTVTWQAKMGSDKKSANGKLLENKDTLSIFFNNTEQQIFEEEYGIQPVINKSLVFFDYHPSALVLRYGIIRPDGLDEVVGHLESGKIAAIPGETIDGVPKATELEFLEHVNLSYQSVHLRKIEKIEVVPPEWQKVESVLLGTFKGEKIYIDLYSDDYIFEDAPDMFRIQGLMKFNEQFYLLPHVGYSQDIDFIEVYPFELEYTGEEARFYLLSAIGPPEKLVKFIVYDENNQEWMFFESYGNPEVADINQDGRSELFTQYSDPSNQDVFVFRYQERNFETADINIILHEEMGIDLSTGLFATTFERKNDKIIVKVTTVKGEPESVFYIFKYDLLERLNNSPK